MEARPRPVPGAPDHKLRHHRANQGQTAGDLQAAQGRTAAPMGPARDSAAVCHRAGAIDLEQVLQDCDRRISGQSSCLTESGKNATIHAHTAGRRQRPTVDIDLQQAAQWRPPASPAGSPHRGTSTSSDPFRLREGDGQNRQPARSLAIRSRRAVSAARSPASPAEKDRPIGRSIVFADQHRGGQDVMRHFSRW